MPYYGGEVTDVEWMMCTLKYPVSVVDHEVRLIDTWRIRHPIVFRTEEDRDRFLSFPENVQLVKDFYMID